MTSLFSEDGRLLVADVKWAADYWSRARGLIGITSLNSDYGLVLAPCRAIHTWFMRISLDVIFFSRERRVVRMAIRVQPFQMVWGGWPAWGVLEMQSGWFPWAHLKEGDQLIFKSRTGSKIEHKFV